jgi:SH3-like domain-containing protein
MVKLALVLLVLLRLSDGPAAAADAAKGEESGGLPVPRFVSLGSDRVNARAGPGTRYPIEWVFVRRGLPVEVVAESDLWRRVRDAEGAEGWVHRGLLSGRRTALIRGPQTRELRREPDEKTAPVARAEPGVIGRLHRCRTGWCQMSVGDRKGWIRQTQIWGVYSEEQFD